MKRLISDASYGAYFESLLAGDRKACAKIVKALLARQIDIPTLLGFIVASGIFTGGRVMGLSGIQMMGVFYGFTVLLTIATGLFKPWGKKATPIAIKPGVSIQ